MARIFPSATCDRFTPGHHVHMIQWRKSSEGPWRPMELVARDGMIFDVSLVVRSAGFRWRSPPTVRDRHGFVSRSGSD